MRRITIDGKEYTFEFSIEATLYNECTEKVMDLMVSAGIAQAETESDELSTKDKVMVMADAFKRNVSDVPQKALTLFYAGLMKHHGTYGDNSVKSFRDAMLIANTYMQEHPDENDGKGKNLYDIMNEMLEIMMEDNFFEKIGLEKMIDQMNTNAEKQVKQPQDHKKKTTKPGNN